MKINLFEGVTLTEATKCMIESIDNADMNFEHVVIVPDRFSLQCEKLLLSTLGKRALFNVRVTSLTRFSVELLSKLGYALGKGDVLSSGQTLLLTAKAINNVCGKFKTLRKGGVDFCHEVSKLIAQFKSSGVGADELNCEAKGMAGGKYHDLALIYDEYEKLLGERLDANSRLALLVDKLSGSEVLKNTKIYFGQFDAFTKAGYNLIKTFVECADEVNISFTQALSLGNEYIYEKDILQKITTLSKECGALVNVVSKKPKLSPQKEAIVRGLYSYEKVRCDNEGYFNLFSCESMSEEVEAVAKLIRYQVFKGKKYSDIQIAVGGLAKFQSAIENVFAQYDIPCYIDSSITADKTILANLVREYFEVAVMGYGQDKLINLLSNSLANDDKTLVEKCLHFSIEGKSGYKKYIEKDFKNRDILSRIEKSQTSKEFEEVVCEILRRSESGHNAMLSALEEGGFLKERNINIQIADIIKENANLISKEHEEKISAREYFKLLQLLLSFKQVSTVPTFVDGVFVGDGSVSFFGESDTLIVMGGENLPEVAGDNGLLSDDDLKENFKSPIEPTIRMLNRRARFKLFSLLPLGQRRLIVFTQHINEEGKKIELPTYLKNLNDIFAQREIKAGSFFFANQSQDQNIKLLSAPLKNPFKKLEENENQNSQEIEEISHKDASLQGEYVSILPDLVFGGKKGRVTQVEQYFACPFKHFATYGLKLKEFEIEKFEPRDVGNVCHKGAELLLEQIMRLDNLQDWDSQMLTEFIDNNFDLILKEERLAEKIEEVPEKDSLIKYIKNQMLDLFEDVLTELKSGSFKPIHLEYKFDDCKIDGVDVSFVGKADRLDEFNGSVRVVDYKTGQTGNLLKELKYGKKVQLFLYQAFAKEKLAKEYGGVFYFNAHFDYAKDEKEKVLLKGLMPNDDQIIEAYDNNLSINGKSEIVSVYRNKKENIYKGNAVCFENMKKLTDYAQKISAKAVNEICEGYVKPKPHKNSCRGCKYASLCGYEKSMGYRKTED